MLKQVQKNARELEDKIMDKFAGILIIFRYSFVKFCVKLQMWMSEEAANDKNVIANRHTHKHSKEEPKYFEIACQI